MKRRRTQVNEKVLKAGDEYRKPELVKKGKITRLLGSLGSKGR